MRPSSYLQPAMQVLDTYVLDPTTPNQGSVCSYLLRPREWDGKSWHIFLLFTPAGTVLQGPLLTGPDGHGLMSDMGLEWFLADHSPDEILGAFASRTWQEQVAERDLRILAQNEADPEKAAQLEVLAQRIASGRGSAGWLTSELFDMGYPIDIARDVGWDYPFSDSGWVCAIHQCFLRHMRSN